MVSESLRRVVRIGIVLELRIIGKDPEFFFREFRFLDRHGQIFVLSQDPPLGFGRLKIQDRDSYGTAFPAIFTNRPIEQVSGSAESAIHEIVIKLRWKFKRKEHFFHRFPIRKVRAGMDVADYKKIQWDGPVDWGLHLVVIGGRLSRTVWQIVHYSEAQV